QVEPLRRSVEDAGPVQGARVVDQHVDPPEPLEGLGRHALNLVGVPHVDLHGEGAGAERLHLGGDREDGAGEFRRRFGALRRDHDGAPLPGQPEGDGPSDAAAGPGDDGDLAGQGEGYRHGSLAPSRYSASNSSRYRSKMTPRRVFKLTVNSP